MRYIWKVKNIWLVLTLDNILTGTKHMISNLGLSQNFMHVTNHEMLHYHHHQNIQAVQPEDPEQRLQFCN